MTIARRSSVPLRTNGGRHPCIILTDRFTPTGHSSPHFILVHLTTSEKDDYYDTTCVFAEGEDENIRAGSCVAYAEARLVDAAEVDEEFKQHRLKIRTIGPAAFQRILDGFRRNAPLYPDLTEAYEEARRQGKAG